MQPAKDNFRQQLRALLSPRQARGASPGEITKLLMRMLLDFGSETPENLRCAKS
jgi:hypothetical protein